jgi:hypothetical protein
MARLLEVTLKTEMGGEDCLNRFNYITEATAGAGKLSVGLLRAMGLELSGGVLPADLFGALLKIMISSTVAIVDVTVRDVYSVTDFVQAAIGVQGSASGNVLGPVNAFGFSTNRVVYNIRRGQKRFVGVPEDNQNVGVLNEPGITNASNLAAAMSAAITGNTGAGSAEFIPVVVSKHKYQTNTEIPSEDPVYAYEYYPEETQFDHLAVGVVWTAKETVRSQVSRQY